METRNDEVVKVPMSLYQTSRDRYRRLLGLIGTAWAVSVAVLLTITVNVAL